jgi:hypothetical protein
MATQTLEEKKAARITVMKFWLQTVKPTRYPTLADTHGNGLKVAQYISDVLGDEWTPENISKSVEALKNNLEGLGVVNKEKSAEEIQSDEAERQAAHNSQVATAYLKHRAPLGLLLNGDFYPASADKIVAFLRRNYPNQPITDEMLTTAVETLGFTSGAPGGSLDWFDKSPEATAFRNVPPPPPRKLSREARIAAGLEIARDPRNHATDGKFRNPVEELRAITKKIVGGAENDPFKTKCEGLTVVNRHGRTDHGFVAELNQIFAHNPDKSVNWAETYRLRYAACDQYEKTRNRD